MEFQALLFPKAKMIYNSHYTKDVTGFKPIPIGCCHVILIYGLILPSAGRNRVKYILSTNLNSSSLAKINALCEDLVPELRQRIQISKELVKKNDAKMSVTRSFTKVLF